MERFFDTLSLEMAFYLPLLAFASAHLQNKPGSGNLTLPKVLDSLMVLQRAPQGAQVWGWATPSEHVTVYLDNEKVASGTASADGSWLTTLPPTPASINHTLSFTSTDGASKTLTGVAFGDVFSCHGQSHMTFSVNQVSF